MSEPFIGEIVAVGFFFEGGGFKTDATWLPCDGRQLAISQHSALFSLIGNAYGGDGITNFNLPNLNGGQNDMLPRIAISQGEGKGLTPRIIGEKIGSMEERLNRDELPIHNHGMNLGKAGAAGATAGPGAPGTTVAINPSFNGFVPEPATTTFSENAIFYDGGGLPHPNNQPTTGMWYCIAVDGIFPTFG